MVVAVAAAGVGGRTGFGVAGTSGGPHLGQPQVFEELRVLADEVVGVCDVFAAGHVDAFAVGAGGGEIASGDLHGGVALSDAGARRTSEVLRLDVPCVRAGYAEPHPGGPIPTRLPWTLAASRPTPTVRGTDGLATECEVVVRSGCLAVESVAGRRGRTRALVPRRRDVSGGTVPGYVASRRPGRPVRPSG